MPFKNSLKYIHSVSQKITVTIYLCYYHTSLDFIASHRLHHTSYPYFLSVKLGERRLNDNNQNIHDCFIIGIVRGAEPSMFPANYPISVRYYFVVRSA